jgi:DNA-binding MarR family transcriptional regulator
MHTVVFHMKRAFQSTLRVTRPLFVWLGLTAARFDMLHAIGESGCMQSRLREVLGVSAPTVSRMLGSLERRGLVSRMRAPVDRRRRWISLTDLGSEVLRHAMRLVVWSGTVERLLLDVLAPDLGMHPELRRLEAFDGMDYPLFRLARGFFDTGQNTYPPWHPDE